MNEENENTTTTMEMEEETTGGDKMQASASEGTMAAKEDNEDKDKMSDAGMEMQDRSKTTKWLVYAVVLVVVLGALWFLFLR